MSPTRLLSDDAEIDLIAISEAVWTREEAVGVQALSGPERVFLFIWNLEAEVNNGGLAQFFENSAGDHADQTPLALRRIGATQMADIVEEANSLFAPMRLPGQRDERAARLKELGSWGSETLDKLDSRFYEYPDDLEGLLTRFVEQNRASFYAP